MILPSNSVALSSEEMMYVNGGGWSLSNFKRSTFKLASRLPRSVAWFFYRLALGRQSFSSTVMRFSKCVAQACAFSRGLAAMLRGIAAVLVGSAVSAVYWMGTAVRFR